MNGFWTDIALGGDPRAAQAPGRRALVRQRDGPGRRRVPVHRRPQQQQGTFEDQSAVYNAVATSLTAWITDERVQDDMIAYSSGNWQARVGRERAARQLRAREPGAPLAAVLVDGLRPRHPRPREVPGVLRRALRPLRDRSDAATPTPRRTRCSRARPSASGSSRRRTARISDSSATCGLNEESEEHNQVIDALRAAEQPRPRSRPSSSTASTSG